MVRTKRAKIFNEQVFARVITVLLFTAVLATNWDIWWHGAVGRDTFWEPPHLLIHGSILIAILLAVMGWRMTKQWKRLALVLSLIVVAAPFDELWHRIFGVEDPSTPLVLWSPPHLMMIFAAVTGMVLLLPMLRRDSKEAQQFFGSIIFGSMLSLLLLVVTPVHPTGPWRLFGMFGGVIVAFVIIGILFAAHRWLPQMGGAVASALVLVVLQSIMFGESLLLAVVATHDHFPGFLIVFSFLLAALVIDVSGSLPAWVQGAGAGLAWGIVLFGFSAFFFLPQFHFTVEQTLIGVVSSGLGGGVAALLLEKVSHR